MDDPARVITRFVEELWNERLLEVADAIFAEDCVTHQLRSGIADEAGAARAGCDEGTCVSMDRRVPGSAHAGRTDG